MASKRTSLASAVVCTNKTAVMVTAPTDRKWQQQYNKNGIPLREQHALVDPDRIIIVSRPKTSPAKTSRYYQQQRQQHHQPVAMDESTKKDIRRMTLGLTDQTTIEQLSRAGHAAQMKREELHALARRNREMQEEQARQQQDQTDDDDDGKPGPGEAVSEEQGNGDPDTGEDEDGESSDNNSDEDNDKEEGVVEGTDSDDGSDPKRQQ